MYSIGYRSAFAFLSLGILCFGIVLPAFGQGTIQVMNMNAGSVAPLSVTRQILEVAPQSAVMLGNVPTSSWTYGCSATSAGMIFGYYDRLGYSNMYAGPANGGVAPLSDLGNSCSLIATKNGFDGRTTPGHVDDYWIGKNSAGPDPWEGVRTEHVWGDCVADYMGTNQWKWDFLGNDGVKDFNVDGGTALFSYGSSWGGKLNDCIPDASAGMPQTELCHGLRLFAESRGYQVLENYTQSIDSIATGGFTFNDYRDEIDHGYPVMIQVTDHTMVGVGYDASSNRVYLHDTWGDYTSWMTWGGSYSGLTQQAVTVLHLAPVPEPSSIMLLSLGVIGALGLAVVYWRQ